MWYFLVLLATYAIEAFSWKCIVNMPTKMFCVLTAMVPCYTANSKFKLHPLADMLNTLKSSNPIVELFEQAVGVSTVNGILSKHMSC